MVMKVKQLRQQAGLTQTQLGSELGCTQSIVANWESEVALPRTRDLPRLASVLNCSINDLFVEHPEGGVANG